MSPSLRRTCRRSSPLPRPNQRLLESPRIPPLWSKQKRPPRLRSKQRIPVRLHYVRNRLPVEASPSIPCRPTDHLETILSKHTITLLTTGMLFRTSSPAPMKILTAHIFWTLVHTLLTMFLNSTDDLVSLSTMTFTPTRSGDNSLSGPRLA